MVAQDKHRCLYDLEKLCWDVLGIAIQHCSGVGGGPYPLG